MMWIAVRRFLGGNWLMVGMVSALVVSVLGWDSNRKAKWVNQGKEQVRVEIDKANDNATKLGKRAAAKSGSPGLHGRRDPTTRDD